MIHKVSTLGASLPYSDRCLLVNLNSDILRRPALELHVHH